MILLTSNSNLNNHSSFHKTTGVSFIEIPPLLPRESGDPSSFHNTTGVSFIEILVVLLLLSLFMSIALPRFLSSPKRKLQKQFCMDFAQLTTDTLQQAITTQKIHQIFFDFKNKEITVKIFHPTPAESDKHKQFMPASTEFFTNKLKIPEQFAVRNFFIQGVDEFATAGERNDAWFYLMPDGSSQSVVINIENEAEISSNEFSLVINPFYSQVSTYNAFSKP